MGKGFYILAWDGYGVGLNMINPHLVSGGTFGDSSMLNWFPYNTEEEKTVLIFKFTKGLKYYKIIE